MKAQVAVLSFFGLLSTPVLADTYHVTFGWTDPTPYMTLDTPIYEAKYRINGGAEITLPSLATPGGAVTITANPGQPIELTGRQCNQSLCSAWMAWATATAPHSATQPQQGVGLTITVTRIGP